MELCSRGIVTACSVAAQAAWLVDRIDHRTSPEDAVILALGLQAKRPIQLPILCSGDRTIFRLDIVLCAYAFLITWRIARRFGGRGLAAVVLAAAVNGPPRDSFTLS